MIEVEIKIAGVGNDGSMLVRIDDVKSVINSYQERIKELEQAQPKWISVEDELPDNHTYVLVLGHGKTQFISLFTSNKFYRQSASKKLDGVNHWMPLPQPPEVKP